jgi:Na+(H+)/acetate symporter ActP
MILAGGSFSMATSADGPRISFALWAEAVAANTVQAAIAANVLRLLYMIILSKGSGSLNPPCA